MCVCVCVCVCGIPIIHQMENSRSHCPKTLSIAFEKVSIYAYRKIITVTRHLCSTTFN